MTGPRPGDQRPGFGEEPSWGNFTGASCRIRGAVWGLRRDAVRGGLGRRALEEDRRGRGSLALSAPGAGKMCARRGRLRGRGPGGRP